MNRLFPWMTLAALTLVTGCGYAFEDYEADMSEAMCTRLEDCEYLQLFGQDYATCVDSYITGVECDTYEKKAAEECVAAIDAATCEDLVDGVGLGVCATVCP